METWRAVKLNLDRSYTVFGLGPYPDLNQQLNPDEKEAPFGLCFLNGPLNLNPRHTMIGIAVAVDEDGLKRLPINRLACSLQGVFLHRPEPLVGPAVVVGSDWRGGIADVPSWTIDLIREIRQATDIAFKYHQNRENN